jgi:hypothetical protein
MKGQAGCGRRARISQLLQEIRSVRRDLHRQMLSVCAAQMMGRLMVDGTGAEFKLAKPQEVATYRGF